MSVEEDSSDEELDLLPCSSDDDVPIPFLAPLTKCHIKLPFEQRCDKEEKREQPPSLKRKRSQSPEDGEQTREVYHQQLDQEDVSLFKMQLDQLMETDPSATPPPITAFLLREYLKIPSGTFRPRQAEVCLAALQGKSTLAICPTGWGKSLCYLFPMLVHRLRYEEALAMWLKNNVNRHDNGGQSIDHVPEHIYTKFCIVVSPLISLMADQATKIVDVKALTCVVLSSQTGRQREQRILEDLSQSRSSVDIIFISPEKLIGSGKLREIISEQFHRLAFLCIDEVHCVSKWAFNFRPSYMCLHRLIEWTTTKKSSSTSIMKSSRIKYLCLTATASKKVIQDLQTTFQIEHTVECCDQYRKNLIMESYPLVEEKSGSPTTRTIHDALIRAVHELPKPMLVYVRSRSDADELSSVLGAKLESRARQSKGERKGEETETTGTSPTDPPKELFVRKNYRTISDYRNDVVSDQGGTSYVVRSYHAALSRELRTRIQQQFIRDEIDVLVATVAFGMGIDKPNIRSVIHAHAPSSVENYVQEIGRAGRDGKNSFCRILYNPYDYYFLRSSILSSYLSQTEVDRMIQVMLRSPCTCVGEALLLIPVESLALELQMAEEIVETVLYRMVLSFPHVFRGIRGHSPVGYKVSHFNHTEGHSSSTMLAKHADSSTGLALVLQQVAAQDAVLELCKNNTTIEHLVLTANKIGLPLDDLLFRLHDLEKCKVISLTRLSKCFVVSLSNRSLFLELSNEAEKQRSIIDSIYKDQESQLFSQVEGLASMFSLLQHPSHEKMNLVLEGQLFNLDSQSMGMWKPPARSLTKLQGVTIVNEFIESNRMRIRSKYEVIRALLGITPKSAIKTGKYAGLVPLEHIWYTQSPYFGTLREFDFKWVLTVVSASNLPE